MVTNISEALQVDMISILSGKFSYLTHHKKTTLLEVFCKVEVDTDQVELLQILSRILLALIKIFSQKCLTFLPISAHFTRNIFKLYIYAA